MHFLACYMIMGNASHRFSPSNTMALFKAKHDPYICTVQSETNAETVQIDAGAVTKIAQSLTALTVGYNVALRF